VLLIGTATVDVLVSGVIVNTWRSAPPHVPGRQASSPVRAPSTLRSGKILVAVARRFWQALSQSGSRRHLVSLAYPAKLLHRGAGPGL